MAHKSGNTSGDSKLSSNWLHYTGFPGDVCVAFFNLLPGNKDAVAPNPLTKEESHRVYNCDDESLSGSTKRWIFKGYVKYLKFRHRIVKIRPRVLHTCGDISTARNMTLNKTSYDWLFDMLIKRPWPIKAAMDSRPS